jgi:hypothetical protein
MATTTIINYLPIMVLAPKKGIKYSVPHAVNLYSKGVRGSWNLAFTPSPWMGEGWGGGVLIFGPASQMNATLSLTPSHQGRGNLADYPLLTTHY